MKPDAETPVIHADLGDGKLRRFFLGADELRQIKRETGRGFLTLYRHIEIDAEPSEIAAVLRLALIGGGASPQEAHDVTGYYATPPRPLKQAYLIAFEVMNAAWFGSEEYAKGDKPMSAAEMDNFFTTVEAALLKSGADLSVLKGKSFAEIQAVFAAMNKEDEAAPAPDAETFTAIKRAAKKGRKK